jgi:hypothetical protein
MTSPPEPARRGNTGTDTTPAAAHRAPAIDVYPRARWGGARVLTVQTCSVHVNGCGPANCTGLVRFAPPYGAYTADRYSAPIMPRGGAVSHRPRVKSGKSIERLLSATDFSLNSVMQLHVAAS